MKNIRFPFYLRLAMVLLSLTLIILLLYIGQGVLIPLFFAVYISFLLYPFAKFLEKKWGCKRGISSLISVSAFVIVLILFLYFITYQLLLFSPDITLLQTKFNQWLLDTQQWVSKEYHIDSSLQVSYINDAATNISAYISNSIGGVLINISEIFFWIIIIFIYTYFMLHHRRLILNFITSLFPANNKAQVADVVMETRAVANNYLVGLFIEFIVMAIANCGVFYLMNIPYAFLLGLLAALLNFIPYLGIITASVLAFIVTTMYGSVFLAMQAVGALLILHILDANILLPRVVGHKVKINALITIIAVLTGGAVWGIAGMFLSIPLTATLKIIFEQIDELKPWAILMGIDDNTQVKAKK